MIAQIYVHGESIKDHLVAVVVPDPVALSHLAGKAGHTFDPSSAPAFAAAVKEPAVVKAVQDAITAHVKATGNVKGCAVLVPMTSAALRQSFRFEIAKAIHLTTEQFTVENDTLTPTFKIKRRNAYELHKDVIGDLYAKSS